MWLATQEGFFSIVSKADDRYHVRARCRKDLDNLCRLAGQEWEIHRWPAADYRYRILLNGAEVADLMLRLAGSLDYPNFKNRIGRRPDQREKLHAYHEVWSILAGLQSD